MASPLRRYAVPQARIRARLAGLLTRPELEELAAVPEPAGVERELAALDWAAPHSRALATCDAVVRMLDGPPREVVVRYRARYACENLKILLRALERGTPYEEVIELLLPVEVLGPGRSTEELFHARSLAEAVERLAPEPFGRSLRRHVRAAGARGAERFRLEAVAERDLYEALADSFAALDGRDRRAAWRVLGVKLDCVNLLRSLRLRTQHRLGPEEVLGYAIRAGRHLGAAERAVLAHEPIESWAGRLSRTPYAVALMGAQSPWDLELRLGALLARIAQRELGSHPFQLGLVLAFLVLVELQAADVQRIVSGRRHGRSEAWISSGFFTRRGA